MPSRFPSHDLDSISGCFQHACPAQCYLPQNSPSITLLLSTDQAFEAQMVRYTSKLYGPLIFLRREREDPEAEDRVNPLYAYQRHASTNAAANRSLPETHARSLCLCGLPSYRLLMPKRLPSPRLCTFSCASCLVLFEPTVLVLELGNVSTPT